MSNRSFDAEHDSVGLGRAMLALFISSLLTGVVQFGAIVVNVVPDSLGEGLLYFIALVLFEAFLLGWCLSWFAWTISIKAAVVARIAAGIAGVIAVLGVFSVAALHIAIGFMVFFVVEYLVAGWIVVLTAKPIDGDSRVDRSRPVWTEPAPWQDESTLYTTEQFLADSHRSQAGG